VHEIQSVVGTAEEAVVAAHTAAEPHATVERRAHDDDVIVWTPCAEHVRLTELVHLTCTYQRQRRHRYTVNPVPTYCAAVSQTQN